MIQNLHSEPPPSMIFRKEEEKDKGDLNTNEKEFLAELARLQAQMDEEGDSDVSEDIEGMVNALPI